jgi:transposase-like protein
MAAAGLHGGVDYPRTRVEFDRFFPDEQACLKYLEQLRWPDGFVCPGCGAPGLPWRMARHLYLCRHCRRQVSVLAGTLFHRTRKPLRLWFLAAWEITSQKYGANALGLQRVLAVGGYKTVWIWLHKLRRAMVRPGREQLQGTVEVDECYLGGVEAGVSGRETIKKAIVLVAVEVDGRKIGRTRLQWVRDLSRPVLQGFVAAAVAPGSTVHTDGWSGYAGLDKRGFQHQITNLSTSPDPAHVVMPGVHRVASLLKRWILGTLQGGIARQQLPYYLDEFTFRFNRRRSRTRGLLFYRLLEQAVHSGPTPAAALYRATGRGPRSGSSPATHPQHLGGG